MIGRITALLVITLHVGTVRGDDAPAPFPRISAETDPSLFALHGYGFSIGASTAPHWHVQVTEFASDLYSFATPSGWNARMRHGTFFWTRYYLRPNNDGFFFGAALAAIGWRYTRPDTPGGAAEQDQFAVMPFAGYRWFPTRTGFYLLPWAGVALPFTTVGDATVGTMTYQAKFPVFPLAAVHVGWEFGR
jgi:hypothetical protein